jgi:hypothetical protein
MLRRAIASDQLLPGDQLPSEAQLIAHFGVARMTVRQAIQELRSEGLVVSEHGRGVFVRPMPPIRERWPQEPGLRAGADMPDFNRWGDAASLIAQAENIRTRMHILGGDLEVIGLLAGDPVVAHKIIRTLAGIGLAESDVLGTLAVRLNMHISDSTHAVEIFNAMKAAQRAFAEACGAAQSAAKALEDYASTYANSSAESSEAHDSSNPD